jgi:hypothetical protein
MKLYHEIGYPEHKKGAAQGIVSLLTMPVPACLWRSYYDNEMKRHETELFGVNYADIQADRVPFRKGFQFWGSTYEINIGEKAIILHRETGILLFHDADKIQNNFVFEGIPHEVLDEFTSAGYKLKIG